MVKAMVRLLYNSKFSKLNELVKKNQYIIGIRGKGEGILRKGSKEYDVRDIIRVLFSRGEERQGIKLFVDTNKVVLLSSAKFRYKSWFYPQVLHKYFIRYLLEDKLAEDVPLMPEYGIKRSRKHRMSDEFSQYMKERCPELLKNPESILHDAKFVDKFYYNKLSNGEEKLSNGKKEKQR